MILFSPFTKNILFLTIVIASTILVLFLYFLPIIRNSLDKKNLNKRVYRILYALAMDKDYYLINNFPLIQNNELVAKLDHILFTNKYIYVISDRPFSGIINGNRDDNIWLNYSFSGERTEINNPLLMNKIRIEKFSKIKKIDSKCIISIVVTNNLAEIINLENLSTNKSYICKKSKLKSIIKKIEKRDVEEFDPNILDREVKEIAKDIYSRY